MGDAAPLLDVRNLSLTYGGPGFLGFSKGTPEIHGADDVSFSLERGRTFALVGESGSGKSTIARAVAGLATPRSGTILFKGHDITGRARRRARQVKRHLQIIFQNPDAALNPRHSVRYLLGRPILMFERASKGEIDDRVRALLESVRLDPRFASRRSRELSGGEGQRVAIARALAADPELIVCDEILSALDVSVQANVIDLLRDLQRERYLAYLFISHDLVVVRWLAHDVGVLYRGRFCEIGPVEALFAPPYHPYTEMLLEAVPRIGKPLGAVPAASASASGGRRQGCVFASRCPRKVGAICDAEKPPARATPAGSVIQCHIPLDELTRAQSNLVSGPANATRSPARTYA